MRTAAVVCALAGLTVLAGCNRGLTLVPVRGQVKLDGKPLEGCAVAFQPVEGGPVASGTTDSDGRFELVTVNRPGAVPGEHYVSLTKQRYVKESGNSHYVFITPEKYAMPGASGFKANVGSGQGDFSFGMFSK